MSIITRIVYVKLEAPSDPSNPDPNRPHLFSDVTGSLVSLLQDDTRISHAGEQVREIRSEISGSDSQVTFRIAPKAANNVVVMTVNAASPLPAPTQPDVGGVTWAAVDRGQDITITAPVAVGSTRIYEFDSPPTPSIKLTITVLRT